MKLTSKYLILPLLTVLIASSCSRKKDTFINRGWHGITGYYNTMYNGSEALIEGSKALETNFIDDYWNILPVERLAIQERILVPGAKKNPNFERAEDKATKAIQKHSMYINGEEVNPVMDEAFIMLGKARYFDGRFVPAQEAFNYVLRRYPTSNSITEARVWKEKVNTRLGNTDVAKENLKEILAEANEEDLDQQDVAEAAAMLAQVYIYKQELDSAITPIKLAAETIKDDEKKARYTYIKGQLYTRLGELDRANLAFDEVIKMNRDIPRRYLVNAYLEKAQNFDLDKGDRIAFEEQLKRLETYYENKPYLDRIYLIAGDYFRKIDSTELAVAYYNKSLRTNSRDRFLTSRNYLTLANLNFDAAQYETAAKYFDSTLVNLDNQTREYRQITKRRKNLDDVILYEGIARANDSILTVANLSPAEQLDYFSEYTTSLRATAVAQAKLDEVPTPTNTGANEFYTKQRITPRQAGGPKVGAEFYFYNPTSVAYGKQQFVKVWGSRELEDNWRTGGNVFGKAEDAQQNIDPIAELENDPRFDPQTYVNLIPTDKTVLDSLSKERNFAYYQLGLIYKEKFKENTLAANKLETLLKNLPEERLILPSKYNLYKIYVEEGNVADAQRVKSDILTNHEDSRYAAILRNPEALQNDSSSPEALYTALYRTYENQQYAEVLEKIEEYLKQFTGDPIVPKLELLKAYTEGRYLGFEAYKEGLNFVALNYPQSEEGRLAAKLYKQATPQLAFTEFYTDGDQGNFKLIYAIDNNTSSENVSQLKEKIAQAIENINLRKASVSVDVYNPSKNFVVVHGFNSYETALGFGELLKDNKQYRISKDYLGISSENYTLIQRHKNLEAYKNRKTE